MENSRIITLPPGRRTRCISRNPCSKCSKLRTPKATVTVSNVASGNSICSLSPLRKSIRASKPASCTFFFPISTMLAEISIPVTCFTPALHAAIEKSPVPQATSNKCPLPSSPMYFMAFRRQPLSMFNDNKWFNKSYLGAISLKMSFTTSFFAINSSPKAKEAVSKHLVILMLTQPLFVHSFLIVNTFRGVFLPKRLSRHPSPLPILR